MAHQFRVLTALAEDQRITPSNHMMSNLQMPVTSALGDPTPTSGLYGILQSCA